MKISRCAVSFVCVAALASPLAAREIVHDLSGFSKISASDHVKVNVYSGEEFRVVSDVSGTARARHLHVEQEGDTLKIWRTGGSSMILMGMADRYEVTVSMPALTSITASSGVDIEATGTFSSTFDVRTSSGADVDIDGLEAESVTLRSSSGSDLDVRGTCTTLVVEASSGSAIDAENLECKDAQAEASSGSEIDLHVSGKLRARASSGGDIDVEGAPVDADVTTSSGGDVSLPDA